MKTTLKKITLQGDDAAKLLQRITTQDVYQCHQPRLTAICNAKGRTLVIFWLMHTPDEQTIYIEQSLVPILLQLLRYYDPFCKLRFHLANETIWASETLNFSHAPLQETKPWALHLIQQGIVTLSPQTSGKYTPHMLNLDKLGAISLTKGCFIGYEVIARTETRGNTKRRITQATSRTPPENALNTILAEKHYYSLIMDAV